MTLLLIDIGNTRVKWARLVGGKMSPQQAAANAGWTAADYARRVIGKGWASSAKGTRLATLAAEAASGGEAGVTTARRSANVEAHATNASRSAGGGAPNAIRSVDV